MNGWQAVSALAIREGCVRDTTGMYFGSLPGGSPIPTAGGTVYLVSTDRWRRGEYRPRDAADLKVEGTSAVITRGGQGGWVARADLAPLARFVVAGTTGSCDRPDRSPELTPEQARVPLIDAQGRSRAELVVTSMSYGNSGANRRAKPVMKLERVEGMVIARE